MAPPAGHYPALEQGPPWWSFDSPGGMLRYRRAVTETAGFHNTAGLNDDHAGVSVELAVALDYGLAKDAYRL